MSSTARHIIHKETFELTRNQHNRFDSLESFANRLATSILQPEIEVCLDSYALQNEYVILDKIEIELGTFSPEHLEAEIRSRFRSKLKEKLDQNISVHQKRKKSIASVQQPSNDDENVIHEETSSSSSLIVEALLFYLLHGRIPWWYENGHEAIRAWLELRTVKDSPFILNTLRQSSSSIPRAIGSLSDEMLSVVCVEAGFGKGILDGWIEISNTMHANPGDYKRCRNMFWQFFICHASGFPASIRQDDVIDHIARFTPIRKDELHFYFASAVRKNIRLNEPFFWKESSSGSSPKQSSYPREDIEGATFHERPDEKQASPEMNIKKTNDRSGNIPSQYDPENETIQIMHAGFIIAHPFLSELFQSGGLVEENKFISNEAVGRAIRLLDYLASGNTDSHESDLLLPKLLCGLDWTDSISTSIQFTEKDIEACDELLRAVIKHWAVLGNTSEEGLRNGFFEREGMLSRKDNGWLLRIENKAQDILLNRLPWGISTIRLPWMKDTLHTSWN